MSSQNNAEDEWEYEYDQHETDVFLVDLDLTTLNRTIRSTTSNRHKRLLDVKAKSVSNKKQKTSKAADTGEGDSVNGTPNQASDVHGEAANQASSAALHGQPGDEATPENGLQILDLHTGNPIVSYKGLLFSCTWTDTIGTTMFFSEPRETPLYDPDISNDDFDMIGTSRIKLAGREAKVTPTSQNTKAATPARPGQSLGTIKRSNAKVNADLRKQANFLEQLMNIKKNRGEEDNVHVVMNKKIAQSIADDKLKFNIQRRGDQIDELNRKVVRGDAEALRKLEQIYSGQDVDDSDDDGKTVEESIAAGEQPPRSLLDQHRNIAQPNVTVEENGPRNAGTASPSSDSQSPFPNGNTDPDAVFP